MSIQGDLAARLRWHAEHDRDELAAMLAATVLADVLHDALAAQDRRDRAVGPEQARPR